MNSFFRNQTDAADDDINLDSEDALKTPLTRGFRSKDGKDAREKQVAYKIPSWALKVKQLCVHGILCRQTADPTKDPTQSTGRTSVFFGHLHRIRSRSSDIFYCRVCTASR